jgi:hypothetical protein
MGRFSWKQEWDTDIVPKFTLKVGGKFLFLKLEADERRKKQ